jgi:imidazoleglycerol phosphate dehydratase HisB
MDDMFSSFDRQYLKPEEMKMIVETIELEARDNHHNENASFRRLLRTIKQNIEAEDTSTNLKKELFEEISDDEIEEEMRVYNEKNNNES